MKRVLILEYRWDTPDNDGSQITVFDESHIVEARNAMRESAEKIREEYREDGEEPWESEYTWEDEDCIHLGFDNCLPFPLYSATIYSWEIYSSDIL